MKKIKIMILMGVILLVNVLQIRASAVRAWQAGGRASAQQLARQQAFQKALKQEKAAQAATRRALRKPKADQDTKRSEAQEAGGSTTESPSRKGRKKKEEKFSISKRRAADNEMQDASERKNITSALNEWKRSAQKRASEWWNRWMGPSADTAPETPAVQQEVPAVSVAPEEISVTQEQPVTPGKPAKKGRLIKSEGPTIQTRAYSTTTPQKASFRDKVTKDEPFSSEVTVAVKEIMKKNRISCPDPSKEIRHLLRMKSLSKYEQYVKNRKRSILKKMGFTSEEISILEKQINSNIAQFMQLYKQAKDSKDHDQTLPAVQLEFAEILLEAVGIEPSSISIRAILDNPQISGAYLLGSITLEWISSIETGSVSVSDMKNNISAYCQQALNLRPNSYDENESIFVIGHEIGHLVKGHTSELKLISMLFADKYNIAIDEASDKIKSLFKEFDNLNEIEADIWFATKFQDIAKIARDATIRDVRRKTTRPDIYLTPPNRLYVLTKIIQLHEESTEKDNYVFDAEVK